MWQVLPFCNDKLHSLLIVILLVAVGETAANMLGLLVMTIIGRKWAISFFFVAGIWGKILNSNHYKYKMILISPLEVFLNLIP